MVSNFVVKFRSLDNIIEKRYPSEFLKNGFKILLENTDEIIISKFFKKSINKIEIAEGEEITFRITTLSKESFESITMKLFRYKLLNELLFLEKYRFEVIGIYSGKDSAWGKTYDSFHTVKNNIKISFYTPIIIKLGSRFLDEFDLFLFFKSIIKNSNTKLNNQELICITDKIEMTNNILIKHHNLNSLKLKIPIITGEVDLDLSNLSDSEYKIIVELLKIGYFIFAGHYRELGYGMYSFY